MPQRFGLPVGEDRREAIVEAEHGEVLLLTRGDVVRAVVRVEVRQVVQQRAAAVRVIDETVFSKFQQLNQLQPLIEAMLATPWPEFTVAQLPRRKLSVQIRAQWPAPLVRAFAGLPAAGIVRPLLFRKAWNFARSVVPISVLPSAAIRV